MIVASPYSIRLAAYFADIVIFPILSVLKLYIYIYIHAYNSGNVFKVQGVAERAPLFGRGVARDGEGIG
jgi:hypothetical protein